MGLAFVTGAVLPRSGLACGVASVSSAPARPAYVAAPGRSVIVASKNAQLKAAKLTNRRRPKKHRPSDINRAAPSVDPCPLLAEGLPPVYSIMEEGEDGGTVLVTEADVIEFNTQVEDAQRALDDDRAVAAATAKVQSKADKIKAKEMKKARHVAHKDAREASIKAFADAQVAAEAAEKAGVDAAAEASEAVEEVADAVEETETTA